MPIAFLHPWPARGVAALACAAALAASPASATIVGGHVSTPASGSTFIKLTVPFTASTPDNTVGNDNFQNLNLYGFDEQQNIVLPGAVNVDAVPAGPLTLAAGTTVASHYVFFDPRATASIFGTVDFDSDIVAIISSTNNLLASDFLANTGVTYLNPSARGLEAGDHVTISGVRQITFDTTASTPGDYVRVFTRYSPGALPEPQAWALVAVALAGLALSRRRAGRA